MEVLARIPELAAEPIAPVPQAFVAVGAPAEGPPKEPARAGGRRTAAVTGFRLPSFSVVALGLVAAAFWGAAWRNERLRLEAQRARPERVAQQLPATTGSPRTDAR